MSTSRQRPGEDLGEKATLRARVIELERENNLLKAAPRAQTEVGGGLQTSGNQWAPELGSLQQIYGAATIGLCCLDTKLRFVFVNEWLAAINGLSVEEHLGRSISEVLPDVAAGVEPQLRRVIETGEPIVGGTVEAQTAVEPSVMRQFQHNYDAIRSADGAIVGVSCVVQDITARKQAEEALHESEERMRLLLEGAFEGIVISEKGKILEANQAFADMFGYGLEELSGIPHVELTTPESAQKITRHIAVGDEKPYEVVGLRRDGTLFDIELVGKNCTYRGRDARITAMRDITERKRAEEAMRLIVKGTSWAFGEDFFRSLTRNLALALEVRSAFVSELREGSEGRLRLLASWEGNDFGENFEYDAQGTPCELVIDKGLAYYPANVQQFFPDDHWLQERSIESYLAVPLVDSVGNCLGHLGVTDDKPMPKSALAESILRIFAGRAGAELLRKRAETLLQHTQFAVEHCSNPIYWVRKDGGIIYANGAACRSVGYSRDELVSMSVSQLYPDLLEEDWPAHWQEMSQVKRSTFEAHHRRKDGWVFPVQITTSFLKYESQDFIWAYVTDITERKRSEEALRESESKYRGLFESASDVISLVDGEGNIVDINRRGELVTGYSRAELRGMNVMRHLVVPEDRDILRRLLEHATPGEEHVYEVRWRAKDGRTIHFEGVSTFRFSPTGEFLSTRCTLRDITERKRAEDHARQLQSDLAHMSRLSSMGEMAAGLAHELNQPLTVITNYAQGCVRRLKSNTISEDELENVLSRIVTQAQRSSSIIRGLGDLVRKSSARRTGIDVNQSIIQVAEMANAEATQHHAKARFELETNLPLVLANQTQFQQVILNLVQNACEATEDTPELRRAVTVRTKRRGDRELEISVSDNGRGISELLGERLFEPFFTTKAEGIGMGLAISRSIVESHGGRLWATPNRGEGTTFHFTLPIVGGHGGDE